MEDQINILSGAEPIFYEGNEIGILVIHGFTGTTQSIRPLAMAYAKAGYTVSAPRLKGHGTTVEDMESTQYQDWMASVDTAYHALKKRCDAVFVVGLSMGGTLALHAAVQFPDVLGVVPINAAIDIPTMDTMAQSGDRFLDAVASDIKKEGIKELAYERTPARSIRELQELMNIVKMKLSSVHVPILVFVSDEDHVVPPHNSEVIFETVFSEHKEIVHLEQSYHVATLDHDQDMIVERTLEFFQMYTNTKTG
ncbi:alpha/beta fold hydrolase [Halobacillus yeomjeoni]|uniref:alpha/beta hydrolase n=1 Tax=Halobacillus yeomjeoni TaxID=311194 RepID=UPI001CD5A3FF|nr:alpha/beta fold hydrolase [Halobacillus yeomjeoni]MCA0983733.1 alpha/beta fold hydrolase [Halobacillus yeomjeoni]